MLLPIRSYLSRATPAQRCILVIAMSLPALLAYLASQSAGMLVPEWRAYLNVPVLLTGNLLLATGVVIQLLFLRWLWPRRFSPRPLPAVYGWLAAIVAITFSFQAIVGGNYTYPTNLVIIGIIPVGLLLLDMRATAIGLVVGAVILWFSDIAILAGLTPYAPGYSPAAFTGHEHAFMAEVLRSGILYVSVAAYGFLVWLLFGQYDFHRRKLQQLSRQDMLTGLSNRRHFMQRLESECSRLTRSRGRLCLVMIDADHFKHINDTHGHQAGDEVLKALAHLLGQHMRVPADLPARVGGEEFAILLPDTGLEGAVSVCERIASSLQRMPLPGVDGHFHVTLSMGVVESAGHDAETLLHFADANLYLAKGQGRNRIVASRIGAVSNPDGVVDAAADAVA